MVLAASWASASSWHRRRWIANNCPDRLRVPFALLASRARTGAGRQEARQDGTVLSTLHLLATPARSALRFETWYHISHFRVLPHLGDARLVDPCHQITNVGASFACSRRGGLGRR
jgi:hypothetical protein